VAELGARILKGLAACTGCPSSTATSSPTTCTWTPKAACASSTWASPPPTPADGQKFEEINNPGTPSYMAPELYGRKTVPPASRPTSTRSA
jgi:hypothetical protein